MRTRLAFNTSDGDRCRSPTEISMTRCEGSCTTYDGLRVRSIYGQTSPTLNMNVIHDTDCGCCTGKGDWDPQLVICDRSGKIVEVYVEVYKYSQCACIACESAIT